MNKEIREPRKLVSIRIDNKFLSQKDGAKEEIENFKTEHVAEHILDHLWPRNFLVALAFRWSNLDRALSIKSSMASSYFS